MLSVETKSVSGDQVSFVPSARADENRWVLQLQFYQLPRFRLHWRSPVGQHLSCSPVRFRQYATRKCGLRFSCVFGKPDKDECVSTHHCQVIVFWTDFKQSSQLV